MAYNYKIPKQSTKNAVGSSNTSYAKLIQEGGNLILEADGHVSALEISYTSRVRFRSVIGPGYLLQGNRKKLIMLSLTGETIEGKIIIFSGNLKILSFKAVGPDAKYVQDSVIEVKYDYWDKLEGEWDSFTTTYEEMDYKGKSAAPVSFINEGTKGSVVTPVITHLDGKNYDVYLNNTKYMREFFIVEDTGIAYTGSVPTSTSQPLSYQMATKPKTSRGKIFQSMGEFFGAATQIFQDKNVKIDYKKTKGTGETSQEGDGFTGVGGSGGAGGGGAGGYG